jgi:hypothetical protein
MADGAKIEAEGSKLESTLARLKNIEAMLTILVRQVVREWHMTQQVAQMVGKAEFTVREWCRQGRIRAVKKRSGRGAHASWAVAHEAVLQYQREGLLPVQRSG